MGNGLKKSMASRSRTGSSTGLPVIAASALENNSVTNRAATVADVQDSAAKPSSITAIMSSAEIALTPAAQRSSDRCIERRRRSCSGPSIMIRPMSQNRRIHRVRSGLAMVRTCARKSNCRKRGDCSTALACPASTTTNVDGPSPARRNTVTGGWMAGNLSKRRLPVTERIVSRSCK